MTGARARMRGVRDRVGGRRWTRQVFLRMGLLVIFLVGVHASVAPAERGNVSDPSESFSALLLRAQERAAVGALGAALEDADRAVLFAESLRDQASAGEGNLLPLASARFVRGDLRIRLGAEKLAEEDLLEVMEISAGLSRPALGDAARMSLSRLRARNGATGEARSLLTSVVENAQRRQDTPTEIRAQIALLRLDVEQDKDLSEAEIEALAGRVFGNEVLHPEPDLLIHFAESLLRSTVFEGIPGSVAAAADGKRLAVADRALREALRRADDEADPIIAARVRSDALGRLAAIYRLANRSKEAMSLSERALAQATRSGIPGAAYAWHTQIAELQQERGANNAAINAYTAALTDARESGRGVGEEGVSGGGRNLSLAAVYRRTLDLILQRAHTQEHAASRAADLRLARDTLEALKGDELRDYFEDDCVARYREKIQSVDQADTGAVILYPFILEDRIEIVVSSREGLEQVVVKVDEARLRREIAVFRQLLEKRFTRQYLRPAKQLHTWLIEPLAPILKRLAPSTLVFVPDGPLRTVPMAALHDGETFLVERYSVAVTPGIELTDPQTINPLARQNLVAGLSESVLGFEALPNVERELKGIQESLPSRMLLNVDFSRKNLVDSLVSENFGLVHLASHAEFQNSVSDGYILTHDGRLGLDELAQAVGALRYRREPLELLVLSACETAAGGERAALGLSGVAIKAGARSALGSLWRVDDAATADFMKSFYEAIVDPTVSRAEAAQRAQRALLGSGKFSHPYYWSPFLMINSWL